MKTLSVIPLSDSSRWDQTVHSFCDYDVYYLSGYVKAFQLHGDGDPILFYYEGEDLRGINVVMKRDIAKDPHFIGNLPETQYFDFATPYGYGGWLLEGPGDRKPLFTAYERWCQDNGVVSEFVRFHPVTANQEAIYDVYDVIGLGGTIALDLSSPETVWANLSSTNRNKIRKAQKNGIHIYNGRFPAIYEQFQEIYNATMDRDHAGSYYYFSRAFYLSILNDLSANAQVFYAQMEDGTIAAASIMLTANGRMSYHLSGSRQEFQHLAPTNLLLYEAALWGGANGCRTLHLGGGVGSEEDGLYHFKKSFYRGESRRFHIGRKIFLPNEYQSLVERRPDLPSNAFFPRYRA